MRALIKVIFALTILSLVGCSFMVKTPTVANYNNLDKIDTNSNKNNIAVLLGGPQGQGLYGQITDLNELDFYLGFAGEFSSAGIDYDFGNAFISYKKEKPVDVIYFTSKATGIPIVKNENISIKLVANSLQLGKSKIDDLVILIGAPQYRGKRINFPSGINHTIAYWDASELQQNGAIKEKWLLVGYDSNLTIQDFIWVSSKESDIKDFGTVT